MVVCMQRWSGDYHEASVALQGREEAVAAQAELLEGGLSLIGATAVEDRLQEGVPQAISTLSAAGIKVAFVLHLLQLLLQQICQTTFSRGSISTLSAAGIKVVSSYNSCEGPSLNLMPCLNLAATKSLCSATAAIASSTDMSKHLQSWFNPPQSLTPRTIL